MSIREELGITESQFRKLKDEIVKEIVNPKPKLYWKVHCSQCNGTGQVVETTYQFRVFERLQDEDLGCIFSCGTYGQAERHVAERTVQPLGTSSMFTIVAPDGEIVG